MENIRDGPTEAIMDPWRTHRGIMDGQLENLRDGPTEATKVMWRTHRCVMDGWRSGEHEGWTHRWVATDTQRSWWTYGGHGGRIGMLWKDRELENIRDRPTDTTMDPWRTHRDIMDGQRSGEHEGWTSWPAM